MFTLTYPGLGLMTADPTGQISSLLSSAESALGDASTALNLFEQTLSPQWGDVDEATTRAEAARRAELTAQLVAAGKDILVAHDLRMRGNAATARSPSTSARYFVGVSPCKR
jgi:hypothetical protein